MKNTKKLAFGFLSSALLLALTSCGGNDPVASSNSEGGTNPVSTASSEESKIANPWWSTTGELEKDSSGNVVFEDVDIALTTIVNGDDKATLEELVSKFNTEYKNKIHVEVTVAHQGIFDETVAKQISENSNPPDLIMGHQKSYKYFTDSKLLQPFNEAIEKSGISISLDDYSSSLSQYASMGYDGYTFGVPIDAQSCVVYYNKSLLAKYGGTLPTGHSSLVELCKKVATGEKITPIAMSTEDDFFTNYVFTTALVQNGATLYNDSYHATWYDDATNRAAFTNGIASLRELTSSSLAQFGLGSQTALNQFLGNKALFYIACPWDLGSLISAVAQKNGVTEEAAKSQFLGATSLSNWFALDEASANANKVFGDSHFFAMSNSVKNIEKKAAICEFVKWFTSTSSVGTEWAAAGHASASTLVSNSDEYSSNDIVENYVSNYYADINSFECTGVMPYYTILRSSLTSLFVSVKTGSASKDADYIKSAQDSMNSQIDFAEM